MENIKETKEKLLEAACTVFSEKGFEKAKVSEIVALAEVAQGTFYLYFKTKQDCLNEISVTIFGGYMAEMKNEAEQIDEKSIHRFLEIALKTIQKYQEIINILHFEQKT